MTETSYSKIRNTLNSFQKDYQKHYNKTDISDDDIQNPSKSVCYNMTQSSSTSLKPILKPRTSRRKAKKTQISTEDSISITRKNTKFKKPLREIHYVESYKEYNIDVAEEGTSWFCGFSCFFQKKKIQK